MGKKTQEGPAVETIEDAAPAPRTQRLDILAHDLGYLPQFVPGAAGRFRANGLAENPRYLEFAAAKVLRRWSDDTQVTPQEIEEAIAEVASATAS